MDADWIENEARRLARELESFGIERAYEMAVEIDKNFAENKGQEFRDRIETMPTESRKILRKHDYIRGIMNYALEVEGEKDRVEAIIDNKMVDVVNSMTDEERRMMADFNAEVAERTYYGMRDVPVKGSEAYCMWSNASASWFCRDLWGTAKETGKASLDANELVVDADPVFLNKHRFLMRTLPLYDFSYEAGERQGVDKHQQIKDWAFRQMESKEIQERDLPGDWL